MAHYVRLYRYAQKGMGNIKDDAARGPGWLLFAR
jgi:hypothetical protein